jgi:hypothetical protein
LGLLEVGKISVELEKFLENIGEGSGTFANLEIGKGTVKTLLIQSGIFLLALESSWTW